MMTAEPEDQAAQPRGISRRAVLGLGGAIAATAGAVGWGVGRGFSTSADPVSTALVYPFTGEHQAGIATPAQDRMYFAAFDLTTRSREDVMDLLRQWTVAAARMSQGLPAGQHTMDGPYNAPPDDTGEAWDLPAAGLTITFGFGRSLFVGTATSPVDRFGLAERLPEALIEMPHFPADNLNPDRSDGDLMVQACADDSQVAVHAVRNLARIAMGTAQIRWTQLGFGRTSSTSTAQRTPRNLFGFKDGTRNVKAEQAHEMDAHVWVQPAAIAADAESGIDSAWMNAGSYLVARRIRMFLETWDRSPLSEQELIFGRDKGEGAPLSGGQEFTEPNFHVLGGDGLPLVHPQAHMTLAHPEFNSGTMMLRRGYNYTDGNDSLGRFDAGLFFITYVTDPRTHYVPMQNAMSRSDLLMEYIQHTASSLWAVPPGILKLPTGSDGTPVLAADGPFVGQELFQP